MCSGDSMDQIEKKLQEYKDSHNGKDFMCDVSTKTIEDICQLLQSQPQDLIEWKVDLKPELSYAIYSTYKNQNRNILYNTVIRNTDFIRNFKGGMTYDSIKTECNNGTGKNTRR